METEENYPVQFKNVIEKIIDAELNKRGITKYISALVKGVNDNGTVNVCIPPNLDSIISGLLNKTGETLSEGDSVELCAKNGSVNNSWVAIKHKTNTQFAGVNTPNTFTQNQTFNENIITKNVVSRNKFNMYNLDPFTSTNITYSGDSFTVTGKVGENKAAAYIITLQPGTYILSGTATGAADFVEFYRNGTWDGTIILNAPFTLNETTQLMMYFYGSIMRNTTTATSTFTNIQLQEGSVVKDYVPYLNLQENIFKDSIARVNNVVSKNKININGYVAQQYNTRISVKNNTARVTCLGDGQNMYSCIKIENINELLGKTCTFKATATSSSSNVPMARIYFGTDNAPATEWANFDLYGETSNTQITSTFPANMPSGCDGAYVLLYGNRAGTGFSVGAYVDYTDIQLEEGSATAYAPYLDLEKLMPLVPKMLPMTVNEEYVYTTDLSYIVVRIGKIAILNIRTIAFKSVVPHGGKIIYGLPPAKNGVIFYLYGGQSAKGDTMRLYIDENGEVNSHYGSNTYYGSSPNDQYGGTLIYETTD